MVIPSGLRVLTGSLNNLDRLLCVCEKAPEVVQRDAGRSKELRTEPRPGLRGRCHCRRRSGRAEQSSALMIIDTHRSEESIAMLNGVKLKVVAVHHLPTLCINISIQAQRKCGCYQGCVGNIPSQCEPPTLPLARGCPRRSDWPSASRMHRSVDSMSPMCVLSLHAPGYPRLAQPQCLPQPSTIEVDSRERNHSVKQY